MDLDFSPYAVGGAAARPDSFTRLDPQFATGVYGLTQAAHASGIPLQITSAYRSPELQAQLYQSALERYGSERAARRMVAPPGRSQHNFGTAVDFALNGSLIRDADSPAAQFIRDNAAQYGLSVPMSWEPWQVEPAANAGRITGAPQARISTRNAPASSAGQQGAALGLRGDPQMNMQPTQPQGILAQLGIQRQDPTAQGETALPFYQRNRFGNFMGNLAMAFNSLQQRPDPNVPRVVMANREMREQDAANNRTIEWLSSQPGGERFAGLVDAVGAAGALQAYQQSRTSPSPTEAQIARLVASGLDYQTAVGIVDGVIKTAVDPITGETVVINLAEQLRGSTEQPTEASPATTDAASEPVPGAFDDFDYDAVQDALGLGGALGTLLNKAAEFSGFGLPLERLSRVRGDLQSLSTQTMLGLTAAFPGRPSNLMREEIRALTIQPTEIFAGADSARQKAQNLVDIISVDAAAAQRVLAGRFSPADKSEAREALEYLEPLLRDYQSLLSAIGRDTSEPPAGIEERLNRYPGASE